MSTSASLPHLVDYFFICGLDCDLGLEPYVISGDDEGQEPYKAPLDSPYKARILQHFPESVPGFGFDAESIALMCMPDGLTLKTHSQLTQEFVSQQDTFHNNSATAGVRMHSFLITVDDATRYYGVTLCWYEEITSPAIISAVSSLQAMYDAEQISRPTFHLHSHPHHDSRANSTPDSIDSVHLSFPNVFVTGQDRLFASKAIGVITHHSQLQCLTSWLFDLWCYAQESFSCDSPAFNVEWHVAYVLSQLTIPLPGHILAFPGPRARLHYCSTSGGSNMHFPSFDYPLRGLLDVIGLENLIKVFTCVLLEYRIVLISEDCRLLMLISECITCLLFPFTWSSAYCPILPQAAKHIVDAPLPLIVGIKRECGTEATNAIELASEARVCIVDVDYSSVRCSDEVPVLPYGMELRNEITRALVELNNIQIHSNERPSSNKNVSIRRTSNVHNSNAPPSTLTTIPDLVTMATGSGQEQDKTNSGVSCRPTKIPLDYDSDLSRTNSLASMDAVRISRLVEEAGVGLPWPKAGDELLGMNVDEGHLEIHSVYEHRDYLEYIRLQHVNMVLREVFLNYFLHLFFDYESFLIRPKASELVGPNILSHSNNSADSANSQPQVIGIFDKLGFLSDQPTTHLDFLSAFLETQMFTNFIDAKCLSQWEPQGDPVISMFETRLQERKQLWAQETWRANNATSKTMKSRLVRGGNSNLLHPTANTPTGLNSDGKIFWTYRSALENVATQEEFVENCKRHTYVIGKNKETLPSSPSFITSIFTSGSVEKFQFPLFHCNHSLRTYTPISSLTLVASGSGEESTYPLNELVGKNNVTSDKMVNSYGSISPIDTRPSNAGRSTPRRSRAVRREAEALDNRSRYVHDARGRVKRQAQLLDMKSGGLSQANMNFVTLLLEECKAKTKRMVVEKLGQEAIALGHGDISLSGVEENTLVTGLCDLLERIWSHEIVQKTGKSAFWSYLSMYVSRQLDRRRGTSATVELHPSDVTNLQATKNMPEALVTASSAGSVGVIKKPPVINPRSALTRNRDGVILPDKVTTILKQHSSPRFNLQPPDESHASSAISIPCSSGLASPGSVFSALRFDVYASLQRKQQHQVPKKDQLINSPFMNVRSSHPGSPTHHVDSHSQGSINSGSLPRRGSVSQMLAAANVSGSSFSLLSSSDSNENNSIDAAIVWEVFGPPKRSIVDDFIAIGNIQQLHSEVAYARAFVRLALEKKLLHAHLEKLLQDHELLRSHYKRLAFLRCSEECEQFLFHLLALNAVDYYSFSNIYVATNITYRVFIYTGRKFSGGSTTSANAWFALSGVHGCTGKQSIPRGLHKFEFDFHNLGCLTTLRLGHDNSGMSANWFVEYVLLQNTLTGHVFKFTCNKWIGRSMEDGSLERLMIAQQLKLTDEHGNIIPILDASKGRLLSQKAQYFVSMSSNGTIPISAPTGFITPPTNRSPSVSRRSSSDARVIANSSQAQPMIQEKLMNALNAIIKYFHQQSHEHQQAHLITLLCGENGLVPAVELMMNHGLLSGRFYQKRIYVWDYLERVADYELGRRISLTSMEMSRVIQDISLKSFTLGKEGRLQRWICRGIASGCLADWLVELQSCPITGQMYEKCTFLSDPQLAATVVSLLDVLKEFHFTMEPALLGEND